MAKTALDKDLQKIASMESATDQVSRPLVLPGIALIFLVGATIVATVNVADGPIAWLVILASVIAGYMALNIGANDVANNMGPAVGSRALTMTGAIVLAAICEASGALIAGGDVVNTISDKLLVRHDAFPVNSFIFIMTAALLSSALWINLATWIGAPVSTTHSVVGGVVGSAMAAAGFSIVAWPVMGAIVASWVVSPLLGGVLAALLLGFTERMVLNRDDKLTAADRWVPILIALMASVFAMYLAVKGLGKVWDASLVQTLLLGVAFGVGGWWLARPWVAKRSIHMENRSKSINRLFRLPLIFAAGLLSFAHGANDVANAVGPLAAIVAAAQGAGVEGAKVALPLWVLAIGAIGIAVGLALFGPRLIRMVGERITKMNEVRAYCVALSAAITVLIASALGLPVSSTHIAIGAVFGVGMFREATTNRGIPNPGVQPYTLFLNLDRLNATPEDALANDRKRERRMLVRRQHGITIAAAWIVTVPAAALLSAALYGALHLLTGSFM